MAATMDRTMDRDSASMRIGSPRARVGVIRVRSSSPAFQPPASIRTGLLDQLDVKSQEVVHPSLVWEAGGCETTNHPSPEARMNIHQHARTTTRSREALVQRVARVLRRHGLPRLRALEPAAPVQRYEYRRPGGLVHLDIKKLGRIGRVGHRITGDRRSQVRGIGWEYVHVAVDDATRLAYVAVLPDEQGVTVTAFLWRALAWYRRLGIRVRRILTDNGSGYRAHVFAQCGHSARLRHLRTRPYTPRTNGKAERFIQTLLREWAYIRAYRTSAERLTALPHWLHYYNVQCAHAGLHDRPPISRLSRVSADNLVRLHS
jgi:transposase InsO family protein